MNQQDELYPYYVKGKIIGHGSFSTVYRGSRISDGKNVAIKAIPTARLNKKLLGALCSEISIMSSIRNRHIVRLYDVKRRGEMIYIIMEYCEGGDLSRFLKRVGIVKEEEGLVFLRQIATAFRELRSQSIIHRDLKPQNILLCHSKSAQGISLKVGDFGLAKAILPSDMAETLCGSPLYMAPEVLSNASYDERADLWSLGVIFYEMLYGNPPFSAGNHIELQRKIEQADSLVIPERATHRHHKVDLSYAVSPMARELLHKLLQKDPLNRMSFVDFFNHPTIQTSSSIPRLYHYFDDGGEAKGIENPQELAADVFLAVERLDFSGEAKLLALAFSLDLFTSTLSLENITCDASSEFKRNLQAFEEALKDYKSDTKLSIPLPTILDIANNLVLPSN